MSVCSLLPALSSRQCLRVAAPTHATASPSKLLCHCITHACSPEEGCSVREDQEGKDLDQVQGPLPEVPVHAVRGRQRQGAKAEAIAAPRSVRWVLKGCDSFFGLVWWRGPGRLARQAATGRAALSCRHRAELLARRGANLSGGQHG
eukprot:1159122-Pelagomonas_calceolata.AAC.4